MVASLGIVNVLMLQSYKNIQVHHALQIFLCVATKTPKYLRTLNVVSSDNQKVTKFLTSRPNIFFSNFQSDLRRTEIISVAVALSCGFLSKIQIILI